MGLLLTSSGTKAQVGNAIQANLDSVDISLLTCGPGNESYSYYGHTGIRIHDKNDMRDLAVNYGLFSFEQKHFVLRFIFGLTDYLMGMCSFDDFMHEYALEGRWVREQQLNLTPSEKESILMAVIENAMPENAEYRYNFLYDNCTTRARDVLIRHINGQVKYPDHPRGDVSYRDMIHQWTAQHPWTRFGNDLLLGVKADAVTTQEQQQFLPVNLYDDFSQATIVDAEGNERPLVKRDRQLLNEKMEDNSFPVTPMTCMVSLSVLVCLVTGVEWWRKTNWWLFDVCLFTVLGLAGLILTAMIFSQHPTVSLNYQILLLNPLCLAGVAWLVKNRKRSKSSLYGVAAAFIILFLIGGFWQTYAEGLTILALSLLIRYCLKWKMCKDKNKTAHA